MSKRYLLGIIGIIIIFMVSMTSYLSSSAFSGNLGEKVAEIASDTLATKVEIGHIAVESSHAVGVKDIALYDKQGEEIAKADYAQVEFSLFGVLSDNPLDGISEINVNDIRANIIQREDGSFNFEDLISEEKSNNNFKGRININNGDIMLHYDNKDTSVENIQASLDFKSFPFIDLKGTGVNQGAEIEFHGNVGGEGENTFTVKAKDIHAENYLQFLPVGIIPEEVHDIKGEIPKLEATLVKIGEDIYYSGKAELENGEAVIYDKKVENIKGLFVASENQAMAFLRASCAGQEAYAHGRILLNTGVPVLNMVVETKDFEPAKILENGDFSGKVNVLAHITGPFNNPVIDADVNVKEGMAEGYSLNNLSAKLHYADNKVFAKDINVDALGGNVTGEAEFNAKDLSYVGHFKINNVEISALQKTGVPVSGAVSGDIALDGVADDIDKLNIYGSVFSEGITYSGINKGRKSVCINSLHTSFAKLANKINIDFLSAKTENGGVLGLKGDILLNDSLNLEVFGDKIDLSKFIVELDGSDENPFAGRMEVKASITGTIANPIIKAEFAALHGKLYFQPFDKMRGSLAGSLRGLYLKEFVMEHGKSRWTAEGMLGYSDVSGNLLTYDPLDMGAKIQLHIKDARVEDLVRPLNLGVKVTGNLDKDIVISGKLRNPHVEGKFHFYEGSVNDMFLQKVDGSYNVESVNGKLVFMVKDVHVETPWINMEVSGTVSDLKNVPLFDLQLKTNDVMLDDFTDRMPYPLTGHARFDGRFTGNVNNPVFEGIMTSEAITINGTAVKEAGGKVLFKNNILTFSNFGFKDNDGSFNLNGSLNIGNNALDGVLQVDKANISTILAMTNFKNDKIYGHADGRIILTGTVDSIRNAEFSDKESTLNLLQNGLLDTVRVKAKLNINDGTAAGYAINNVDVDMELKDSILNINSFRGSEGTAGKFAAKGSINLKNDIKAEVSLNDIDTGMLAGIGGLAMPVSGKINGALQCGGTIDNPVVDMSVEAFDTSIPQVKIDKAYTMLHLEDNIIHIEDMAMEKKVILGETEATYRGSVKGTVPLAALSEDENVSRGSSMDVTLYVEDADLSLLPGMSPAIEWAFGETDGQVHISGNILEPKMEGHIAIHGNDSVNNTITLSKKAITDDGASIKIKGLENVVENVSMVLNFKDNVISLDHFKGKLGNGSFNITGKAILKGIKGLEDYELNMECDKLDIQTAFYRGRADLSLNVTKANIERVKEFFAVIDEKRKSELQLDDEKENDEAKASPWLKIAGQEEEFKKRVEGRSIISGKLVLDDAIISIPSLESSDDPLPDIFMNLELVMGNNVRFFVPQLADLRLAGSAHIGGSTKWHRSSGSIYVKKGTISYLKNVFKVKEGALLFNQSNSLLPAVKLLADTKIGNRRVFININGPLYGNKEDILKLSSSPELSEENIIKLLTLRGAYKENGENSWENTAGAMAISGLQMALLGDVEESLRNSLNLDYFSIERDYVGGSNGNGNSKSMDTSSQTGSVGNSKEIYNVVLGKDLSDKTSIRLSKSVNSNDYRATFEYDFNDRINFNVSKDSDKGMIYGFEAVFSF